ncbi:MAG: winged helix-turn-helix transcriptional regulator, partial [Chloroflexota bacterium]|nr:winged helix-turn-helix transcriptional regulator [Chloroflexota bacterium]
DQDVAIRSGRAYNQYCGVARGLDLIGERWTLLIVRDLLVGPKRYKDLLKGLPGIGTNLLATRLRELEQREIVRRTVLPPPAGSTVYELTAIGRELEPALLAIGRWGARFLGQPRASDALLPTACFLALRAAFSPQAALGLTETYALHIGNQVFEVHIEDGQCTTSEGRMSTPDVVMTMDVLTLNALLMQGLPPSEALASRRVKIEGDSHALERFVGVFSFSHVAQPSPGSAR